MPARTFGNPTLPRPVPKQLCSAPGSFCQSHSQGECGACGTHCLHLALPGAVGAAGPDLCSAPPFGFQAPAAASREQEEEGGKAEGGTGLLLGSYATAWKDVAGGKPGAAGQSSCRAVRGCEEKVGSCPGQEAALGARQEGADVEVVSGRDRAWLCLAAAVLPAPAAPALPGPGKHRDRSWLPKRAAKRPIPRWQLLFWCQAGSRGTETLQPGE